MGNNFAESRRKRLEEGRKFQKASDSSETQVKNPDFREQRIDAYNFAESRRKRLEEGRKFQKASYSSEAQVKNPDFREQRINAYNRKKKWANRIDTDVWQTKNPLEEFAVDYAARQEAQKRQQELEQQRQAAEVQRAQSAKLEMDRLAAKTGSRKPSAFQELQAEGTWQQDIGKLAEKNLNTWNEKKAQEKQMRKEGTFQDGQYLKYADVPSMPDLKTKEAEGRDLVNEYLKRSDEQPIRSMFSKDYWDYTTRPENSSFASGDERQIYHYLVGRYGMEAGTDYLKSISTDLNKRAAEAHTDYLTKAAAEDSDGYLSEYARATMTGYIAAPAIAVKQTYHNLFKDGEPMDPNDPLFRSEIERDAMRQGFKNNEKLAQAIPNEGIRNFVVDTGLSMGENLIRLPLGTAGLGLAAAGAGIGGMRDALERGATGGQALTSGIAQGAAEAFFEKFSLDKLSAMKSAPVNGVRTFLKNMGKQGLIEGSEEMATEVANTMSDMAIMKELSQANRDYEALRASGKTDGEAKAGAFLEVMKRIGLAGLGGAVSGGIMGGGAQALGLAGTDLDYWNAGRQVNPDYRDYMGIDAEGGTEAQQQEGKYLLDLAQEYAQRQAQGEVIPPRARGKFDERLDQYVRSRMENDENVGEIPEMELSQESVTEEHESNIQAEPEKDPAENLEGQKPETETHYERAETAQQDDFLYQTGEYSDREENAEYGPEMETIGALQQATDVQEEALPGEAEQFGPNGKTAYVDNYDHETWMPAYTRAFQRAYAAGRYNIDMDIAQRSATLATIGNDQFMAAWKAGVQDRELAKQNQATLIQGAPRTGGLVDLSSGSTSAQRKVAEHVGKMTGLQIELVDGLGSGAQASYGNGKIRISINSDDFLGSTSHELTHFIKEYAAEEYQYYEDTAVKALMKANNTTFEKLYEQYANRYADSGQRLTHDEIVEEMVADATQKFFNDEEFIQEVAAKNETVGQKILAFINDVINAIQSLIKTGTTRKAAVGLEENLVMFKRARRNWMYAQEKASTAYRSGMTQKEETIKTDDLRSKTRSAENSGLSGANRPSINSIFEKNDGVNENTGKMTERFSLTEPLEETEDLIAVHNLTEDKALEEKGIKTVFYGQDREDSKKDAVNSVEGIRFQLDGVDDYTDEHDVNALLKENSKLREANELLKKQFELTKNEELRQSDIHKVSVDMLKKYGSRMKTENLDRNLTRLYEYIRSSDHVDWKEVSAVAADIGREMLKQSTEVDTSMSDKYEDLRSKIRNTKIMITDQDKQDMTDAGGYNSFRKRYFGTLKLGKDGISVDSLYQELSDQYPELFNRNITHPADQLAQIGTVMELTRPQIRNPYHADMDEMAYLVGQELLQEYYNVRQPAPTFADRRAAELEKVKKQYQEKLEEYKNSTENQYKALLKDARREAQDIRDAQAAELRAQKAKYDKRLYDRRESLRKREAKTRIIREVNRMGKWLLEPTDKNHIPEGLRSTVAEFLGGIDFSSKTDWNGIQTNRTQQWLKLKSAFDEIRDAGGTMKDDAGNILYVDVDPDMAGRIKGIVKKIESIEKLEDLDAETMEEVLKTVQSMKKALTEINDLKRNKAYGKASLMAEQVFQDTAKMRDNREFTGAVGAAVKLMNVEMLDPQTMFEKMGPAMKSTYDGLRAGLNKKTERLREAEEYFAKALDQAGISRKDIRKWIGVGAPTQVFDLNGGRIELSIPQIMSLYELNKRQQARNHLYDRQGGMKAGDLKRGISLDNRTFEIPENRKGYRTIRVTPTDVKKITDTLTTEQKKLADAMQRFMGNDVAEWGNETSMEMYGYKKFMARDYFPIKTDTNDVYREEGELPEVTIKNLGITKEANPNAKNPIVIEDIFEVFTRQVDQMSSYNAYVAPLSDLHKVLNYKDQRGYNNSSVREQLEAAFGKAGVQYIEKLVADINGSVKPDNSTGIMSTLLSNAKAASVAGNLRVAVQQPTAIARAYAEMDAKYIAGGIMKPGADWDLIVKYAPIAQWKDWGFYQMQVSRQMKDVLIGSDSAKQRLVNHSMMMAEKGDKMAWKRLWNAAELEIKDRQPTLEEGSEEFYQAVGQRFSEIIDRTQVVDSVLHRPQIMRSKDGGVKQTVSFMAEPMKAYNMLYRAMWNVKNTDKKSEARKQAVKKMGQAGAAYVASAFLTAVAAASVDAFRDDDRNKTYGEKYKENFKENLRSNILILNNIPYIKDVLSIYEGYSARRMELQGIQDIYYAHKKVEKAMKGEGKYTPQFVFMEAIRSISGLIGVPIKSITRDALAIIDTASNWIGGEADYKWLKNIYDISHKENLGYYVEMMMQAEQEGDSKQQELIKKDLMKAGFTEEDIDGKINAYLNDYMENELGLDIPAAAMAVDPDVKGSADEFQRQVRLFIETKKKAGWDEKKSLAAIKSKLTDYFKPLWQQAKDQKERGEIIAQCNRLYYRGKQIYAGYDFSRWMK